MNDSVSSAAMPGGRNPSRAAAGRDAAAARNDDRLQVLRKLGGQAHQLRAALRGADHFLACADEADRNTGSWLVSCAVGQASELAADLDGIGRTLKEQPPDPWLATHVQSLRTRAHQLHAAARAADHFLEQDTNEDRDTGSWLIPCALGLAEKLAAELDDGPVGPKRGAAEATVIDAVDPVRSASMMRG
ncbi:MAG: hypothetical protein Q8N44_04705 [Rubrivivax sp.]|nr:hypothetical protein [Rubrivivax sp.]